ncbi:hypothetical protein FDUTEX481_04092 [Tolypothrix sp. PCC 7601]|nr:hypothetical protein FDUTEX481_04092 [Tolypothrix sp. PCC 7601]
MELHKSHEFLLALCKFASIFCSLTKKIASNAGIFILNLI